MILEEKFAAEIEGLEAAVTRTGEPLEQARQAGEEFLLYVDRDPELDNGLYATLCEVFLRGLVAMTAGS